MVEKHEFFPKDSQPDNMKNSASSVINDGEARKHETLSISLFLSKKQELLKRRKGKRSGTFHLMSTFSRWRKKIFFQRIEHAENCSRILGSIFDTILSSPFPLCVNSTKHWDSVKCKKMKFNSNGSEDHPADIFNLHPMFPFRGFEKSACCWAPEVQFDK